MRTCVLIVVCVVLLSGCSSNPSNPSPSCTFTLSSTSVTVGAAGGTGSVAVSAGSTCAWTGVSNASWITVTSGASATGSGTFGFTASGAPDSSSRTGTVTVANQTVTVTQQGQACSYAVSPASVSFGASGGTSSFAATAPVGCTWTATASANWLTVTSGASGSGGGTISYSVAANSGTASRTGSISLADQAHTVTQTGLSACTVTLSRDDEVFATAGGAGTFDVTAASTCDWMVVSNATWITITDPGGGFASGSRRVSYSVAANAADAARTGTITIGGQTFVVTQAGAKLCTYSVAPAEFTACFSGLHDVRVTVTTDTGCGWTGSPAVSWLTVTSGASGYGPGSITFNVGTNYEAPPRQGNIEVRWPTPTAGQNVRVRQAGCFYTLLSPGLTVGPSGGDYWIQVVAYSDNHACEGPLQNGCTWTAVSSASWVTFPGGGRGGGLDVFLIRVSPNTTGLYRQATVAVQDQTLRIMQASF